MARSGRRRLCGGDALESRTDSRCSLPTECLGRRVVGANATKLRFSCLVMKGSAGSAGLATCYGSWTSPRRRSQTSRARSGSRRFSMRIKLTSIMVDDQDKALRFYTDVLGFEKKHDIPVDEYRWITVTSPEGPSDLELALEPNANPAGKAFQEAMFSQGIPLAAFEVTDIKSEFARLTSQGVAFSSNRHRPAL